MYFKYFIGVLQPPNAGKDSAMASMGVFIPTMQTCPHAMGHLTRGRDSFTRGHFSPQLRGSVQCQPLPSTFPLGKQSAHGMEMVGDGRGLCMPHGEGFGSALCNRAW